MSKLTLPAMPEGFTLTVESTFGDRWLMLDRDNTTVAAWQWTTGTVTRDTEMAGFEIPTDVQTVIDRYIAVDTMYPWAENAHAPRNQGESYPVCGLASFSTNRLDANPVLDSDEEFTALAEEQTCWECRSIIA